jgi:hypothetical protein
MTESAGPRFGSESSRKIIEVRRQSKLIINHFRGVPGDGCHRPRCRRNVSPTDIEVESVTAKHGSNPPPGRDRAEGEGEMNKPSTRPAAPATTQAHCNTCRGTRKHDVLFSKRKHWDDSVDGGRHSISGTDTYSLIACGGVRNNSPQTRQHLFRRHRARWIFDRHHELLSAFHISQNSDMVGIEEQSVLVRRHGNRAMAQGNLFGRSERFTAARRYGNSISLGNRQAEHRRALGNGPCGDGHADALEHILRG